MSDQPPKPKRPSARPLYRDIYSHFEGKALLLGFYSVCLAEIAWGDYTVTLRKKYRVQANQFVSSLANLSKKIGRDKRWIKRDLAVLTEMGVIRFEPVSKQYLMITVTNEVSKTAKEADSIIPPLVHKGSTERLNAIGSSKRVTSPDSKHIEARDVTNLKRVTSPDSNNLNEGRHPFDEIPSFIEKKRVKEERKKKTTLLLLKASTPKFTFEDIEIAKLWLEYAIQEMSWTKPPASWTEESFAESIAKVRKATNLNQEGLLKVLNYVKNDSFWVKNALSPASLLKKSKNEIRKIDNILIQMKSNTDRQTERMERWKDEPIPECPFIF